MLQAEVAGLQRLLTAEAVAGWKHVTRVLLAVHHRPRPGDQQVQIPE
jgi:hypothetical protein